MIAILIYRVGSLNACWEDESIGLGLPKRAVNLQRRIGLSLRTQP